MVDHPEQLGTIPPASARSLLEQSFAPGVLEGPKLGRSRLVVTFGHPGISDQHRWPFKNGRLRKMVELPEYRSAQTFKNLLRKTIVRQEVFAKFHITPFPVWWRQFSTLQDKFQFVAHRWKFRGGYLSKKSSLISRYIYRSLYPLQSSSLFHSSNR